MFYTLALQDICLHIPMIPIVTEFGKIEEERLIPIRVLDLL